MPDIAKEFLLILACSQRKIRALGPIPAFERYDGVNFRVLKKAKRLGFYPNSLEVLILSAQHGLITPDTPIEDYDLRMTRKRATEMQNAVSKKLDLHLVGKDYQEIFINLGRDYLIAIEKSQELMMSRDRTQYASGGIGQKMSDMKRWLEHIAGGENPKS